MGWATAAVVGAAVVGSAMSYSSAKSQQKDEWKRYAYANEQSAIAAKAEADAMLGAAEAQAEAIKGQAHAEAQAFQGQAAIERDLLYKQAEEARQIAYKNIEKMQMEATESLRRLESDQTAWESKAKAKAAASGVRREGSTALAIEGLEEENERQYGWLDKSYKSGLDVAQRTAANEYAATKRQGDAAVEAGGIRAKAAMEAAGHVAAATMKGAAYSAAALRAKADSYLAPVQRQSAATAQKKKAIAAVSGTSSPR